MCVIAFAWHCHPRYPLVVTANRDEFHGRPTRALEPWDENQDVIGGRDLRAGGSWMGARRGGRFAAVTNVRTSVPVERPRSRGALVADFLLAADHDTLLPSTTMRLLNEAPGYGAFNLLLGDSQELLWLGNEPTPTQQSVHAGIHGVSNGEPSFCGGARWPKVRRLTTALEHWLNTLDNTQPRPDVAPLFAVLADRTVAPDSALPDTGVGLELERRLSPVFLCGESYGTRCSTVVLINTDGGVWMQERRFGPSGVFQGESELSLP